MQGARRLVWVTLVAGGSLLFQSCGGESMTITHGQAGHGQGATGGTGGGGGTSTAGRGGAGGSGGAAAQGGSSGGTGSGATGGDAGSPSSCECRVLEGGAQFSCTLGIDELAARMPVPTDCSNDLDYVELTHTYAGGLVYEWSEGGENLYRLVVDYEGRPVYASASGYVSHLLSEACDLSGANDQGDITAGTNPMGTRFDPCTVCGDSTFGAGTPPPACLSCVPSDVPDDSVTITLEEYCTFEACPTTIAEAVDEFTTTCGTFQTVDAYEACGQIVVEQEWSFSELAYVFGAESKELIGVRASDDVAFGPCYAWSYEAGEQPQRGCTATAKCYPCTDGAAFAPGIGAAGAGGAGADACEAFY